MIKKFKLTLLLILMPLLICSLSSCGKDNSKIVIFEEEDEPTILSLFSQDDFSYNDLIKYWADSFTKKNNKKVYINYDSAKYYASEGQSYRELLEKRLISSSPDDMYVISAEDVIEFEKKGYWMDLSDMDFVKNLSDAALYQSIYNNKVFSLPLSFTGFGFLWNVDMLNKYSLKLPTNLSEFYDVCETLKTNGITPYVANHGYALTVPVMCAGFAELYNSSDKEQKIASLNSGETKVSTYLKTGYLFLEEMIKKGYFDPTQALSIIPRVDDVELFKKEQCAFICTGLSTTSTIGNVSFEYKITGLPILSDRSIAVYGADTRLCINPNSKNLETAKNFVEMLGTTEALAKSSQLDCNMSSAKNSNANISETTIELVKQLGMEGQVPNQDFSLNFNTWENIRDIAREVCQGITILEACRKIDELQLEELANFRAI